MKQKICISSAHISVEIYFIVQNSFVLMNENYFCIFFISFLGAHIKYINLIKLSKIEKAIFFLLCTAIMIKGVDRYPNMFWEDTYPNSTFTKILWKTHKLILHPPHRNLVILQDFFLNLQFYSTP